MTTKMPNHLAANLSHINTKTLADPIRLKWILIKSHIARGEKSAKPALVYCNFDINLLRMKKEITKRFLRER